MSQSLLYLEKRQLLRAAPVFIVVFGLPGQLKIFYANGRTIIHCPIKVKQKMRAAQIYFEKRDKGHHHVKPDSNLAKKKRRCETGQEGPPAGSGAKSRNESQEED
ncbi:hypothetical protein [Herbaspirillum rhizosphaerae]|uniref:hypothetical protein n=1 Tax=Herbaspirillum rhizosphaerae TaxID=346179 RepID=UPI0012EE084E|nr:hypothetical protein [Herbaspirillum rhizosphaerae]